AVVEDDGDPAVGAGRGGVDGGDDLTGQRVEGGVVDVLVADLDDAHSPGDGLGHGLGDAATGRLALGGVGDEVEAGVDTGEAVTRLTGDLVAGDSVPCGRVAAVLDRGGVGRPGRAT